MGCNGSDKSSKFANIIKKAAIGFAAAAAISINGCDSSALAESLTIAFPASRATEVYLSQQNKIEMYILTVRRNIIVLL